MSNRQLWKAVIPFMEVGDDGTVLVADSTKQYGLNNVLVSQVGAQQQWGGAAAFNSNAYTITVLNLPSAYYDGMTVRFKAANANTGAATLNVASAAVPAGLGAKTLQAIAGTGLSADDIDANKVYEAVYSLADDKFLLVNSI